ncbi:MAG: alanine dehydrogenase [Bacteroidota bacterium]|jgi:alanine dehydrogenase|nr:alanine dehydrogenase [Bacteroidota bacterium]
MTSKYSSGLEELAKGRTLYPQESLLKIKENNKTLFIGLPKEIALQENRICLRPEAVAILVNNGHEVWIEAGAGNQCKFSDKEYSDAGAKIKYAAQEVFEADIILKVEPPTLEEVEYMKPGKTLISALQLGNQTPEFIEAINKKKIIAIGFELIEDKVGGMPVVRAMSEIAGSTVMLIAAEYLSSVNDGRGVILGGITGVPPTKVIILGAGTVAEYAARAALGLGAKIEIYDNHIYKLRRIKHALGHQIYTSTIDNAAFGESLKTADVVIGAIRAEKGRVKVIVTEEMISQMRENSIVIDVSIDQGGCFETSRITTHKKPIFRKHGILHYCVPNIPARVARTASTAFSNIFTPILLQAADSGGVEEMIFSTKWFTKGVYSYKGSCTNIHIAQKFKIKYKDLGLLMAARF